MMWWNDTMGWGGWSAMALTMGIFWGLVIFGVVAIFRSDRSSQPPSQLPSERTPMQMLDERFARGEIEADEYHARREVLRANH